MPVRRPRFSPIFVGMIALVSLGAFESLAVSTAMPVIAKALDGVSLYAPAFSLTIATSVVGMVLAGRSTDKGDVGPALLGGVGVFVLGLLFSGLAPSMEFLLVGRAFQGLGSGAYIVALYVIVARNYEGRARAGVLAAFSTAWVIPSLVGPLIAGFIVENLGWHWVFLLVAILTVPAVLLLLSAVKTSRRNTADATPAGSEPNQTSVEQEQASGDPADTSANPTAASESSTTGSSAKGAVAWAAGAGVGVALMSMGSDNLDRNGYLMMATGTLLVVICGPRLLPTGTLRAGRGLPTVIALRGLIAAAFLATEVYLPYILQHDRGFGPAQSGIILTAGAITWAIGSTARSRLLWSNRTFLRVGTSLVTIGILIVSLLVVSAVPVFVAYFGWAVAGLGIGMVYPTLAVLVFDLSPTNQQGSNTSALQISDSLTSAFFLAIAGILVTVLVPKYGPSGYLAAFSMTAGLALIAVLIAPRAVTPRQNRLS